MRLKQITIVGLGLIGGSLAAASRKAFPRSRIVGVSRSRRALAKAKKRRWIHEGTTDLKQGIKDSDLVVLSTPVDTLKELLKRIDRGAAREIVVTDAGSVKGFLVRWAERVRWRHVRFVGAHPMAGSHQRGIDAAQPNLFDHALTFITPGRKVSPPALRLVKGFWKCVSSRIVVMSPEQHDRLAARVSHFPHLLASLLVTSVPRAAFPFVSSGFLDTTRIAQGTPRLWLPILTENRGELVRSLRLFAQNLERVEKLFKGGNFRKLQQLLGQAQKRRLGLERSHLFK